jgi:DNA repair photolyase
MIIEEYEAQSLIRKAAPSLFSWTEVYLNPYQGCYHDCKYCDGKSERYYMHSDYSERIRVKKNAPHLLEHYLKKRGFLPLHRERTHTLLDFIPSLKATVHQPPKFILFIGGGVCDVYQPVEQQVRMTRALLHIAQEYGFPVFILTKNRGVLEDIDILKEINHDSYASVSFSITLSEEKDQKIFEPRASITEERCAAIHTLRREGIHSGIHFYPVLPFIGDTDENMQTIYDTAQKVGAEFVYCWGLTLKPGRNKSEFLSTVKEHYSSLFSKYTALYGNNNPYGHPDRTQIKALHMVSPEVKGYVLGYERGIPYCADRYVPEGQHVMNIILCALLLKITFLKRSILRESSPELQSVYEVVQKLEEMNKDISSLDPQELTQLQIPEPLWYPIHEYMETGESSYLRRLEAEAYASARNQLDTP